MPQRSMLYIAKIQHGKEADLRQRLQNSNLPDSILDNTEVSGLTTYIGSGYFVLEFIYDGEDFTKIWNALASKPEIQEMARSFSPYIENGLNLGETAPAQMPLAAVAAAWPKGFKKEISGSPVMRDKPGNEHMPKKENISSSGHAGTGNA